jgi:transposase
MAAPYSVDLRIRAIKAYEDGDGTQTEIAKLYSLGIATFRRYWKQYKETGSIVPVPYKRGRKPAVNEKQMVFIRELVLKQPDSSLKELCSRYNVKRTKKIGISIMFRAICALGFRRKKKSLYASQQDNPEVKKTEKSSWVWLAT